MHTAKLARKVNVKSKHYFSDNWDAQKSLTMVLVYKETRITEIMTKQILLLLRTLSLVLIKTFSLEVLVACKLLNQTITLIIYNKLLISVQCTALGFVEEYIFYSFHKFFQILFVNIYIWDAIFLLA